MVYTVKDQLPHGYFLPWIESEFGMGQSTAKRFIQCFEAYGNKTPKLGDLTPSVLYELSAPSTPEPVREEIESRAASGESVTVKEVKELKQQPEMPQIFPEKKMGRNVLL